MTDGAGGFAAVALRAAALLGILGALGGWTVARIVVPRAGGAAIEPYRVSLAQVGAQVAVAGAALIALLLVPRAVVQALGAAAPDQPAAAALLALLRSPWGVALLVQGLAAALVFLGFRTTGTASESRLADAGVAVIAVTPAFLGHAVADPDHPSLSVIVDVLHVGSAGGWIGALIVLTVLARMLRAHRDAGALLASLVVAFHPVALVSAAVAFATGLATAWLRMGAPEGIANSTYSGLFVAKVVLVFATGALGAGHAKLAKKRVTSVDASAVHRSLLSEALLAALVLLVTAVLAGTPPIG